MFRFYKSFHESFFEFFFAIFSYFFRFFCHKVTQYTKYSIYHNSSDEPFKVGKWQRYEALLTRFLERSAICSDLLPAEVAGKEVLDVYELVFMVVGSEQKEGDKNTL